MGWVQELSCKMVKKDGKEHLEHRGQHVYLCVTCKYKMSMPKAARAIPIVKKCFSLSNPCYADSRIVHPQLGINSLAWHPKIVQPLKPQKFRHNRHTSATVSSSRKKIAN
eukprot:1136945-Pelagomonas_calceolata.AAC.2